MKKINVRIICSIVCSIVCSIASSSASSVIVVVRKKAVATQPEQ